MNHFNRLLHFLIISSWRHLNNVSWESPLEQRLSDRMGMKAVVNCRRNMHIHTHTLSLSCTQGGHRRRRRRDRGERDWDWAREGGDATSLPELNNSSHASSNKWECDRIENRQLPLLSFLFSSNQRQRPKNFMGNSTWTKGRQTYSVTVRKVGGGRNCCMWYIR